MAQAPTDAKPVTSTSSIASTASTGKEDTVAALNKIRGWIIVQGSGKSEQGAPQPVSYTIGRMVKYLNSHGFDMSVINSNDIDVYLTADDRKSILVSQKVTKLPRFVLARTGAKTDFYTLAVYRHLEHLDVPVINSPTAIDTVKDKLFTLQILAQNDIPVPKTILLKHPVNSKYVINKLGLPIIIKLLSGMQGNGVFMAETEKQLKTYCDLLVGVNPYAKMIFQECVKSSLGRDVRVLVVGGKIVGAMMRSNDSDFRANIHRGATGTNFKLPSRGEYLALATTRILGLDVAGVDLLFDDANGKHFKICEVNSSPGFEGFEKATGLNVSKYLKAYIQLKCNIPPPREDDDDTDDETKNEQNKDNNIDTNKSD